MTSASRPTEHPELVTVTAVRVLSRYVVELTFDTGECKVLDLEPMLWGPVFAPIRASYEVFREIRVDRESGTIVWPNGADLAPDELYLKSKTATPA